MRDREEETELRLRRVQEEDDEARFVSLMEALSSPAPTDARSRTLVRPGEFTCASCHIVQHVTQLGHPSGVCRDCLARSERGVGPRRGDQGGEGG